MLETEAKMNKAVEFHNDLQNLLSDFFKWIADREEYTKEEIMFIPIRAVGFEIGKMSESYFVGAKASGEDLNAAGTWLQGILQTSILEGRAYCTEKQKPQKVELKVVTDGQI